MILEEMFPSEGISLDLKSENLDQLDNWYPKVPGLRFNYVISAKNSEGSESNLSTSDVDRKLLRFIRSQSDLIVTTGVTARKENLSPSKFAPMLVITSSNEDFDFPAVQNESTWPVYTTQKLGTQYSNPNAIAIGRTGTTVGDFLTSFMDANGYESVALETGLSVTKQLIKENLISEICLTVTNCSTRFDADVEAKQFLSDLGVGEVRTIQVLRSQDSWFFRFGSLSANYQ